MSKLPEKAVLDGSKIPKTTTGEMKEALGELHDYLKELLGEDSGDKESARLALGIDLEELSGNIDAKADRSELSSVAMTGSYDDLKDKPDLSERGVPIGTVAWFAMPVPPAGYLKCDGAAVGRETCPELFAAIGTTFGAGDGETTFNLPDLIGRFAEGSATPGTVKEAGLPNLVGYSDTVGFSDMRFEPTGCFYPAEEWNAGTFNIVEKTGTAGANVVRFDASHGNPTYGKSDTVQPPALTLLPCIKAFDAAVDSGLIDITELANEVAGKADKIEVANLAMPSDSYVDLTIPSLGEQVFIAPADGYVCVRVEATEVYQNITLSVDQIASANQASGVGYWMSATVPVRKGKSFAYYWTGGNTKYFRFYYAEGSQP